VGTSILLKNGKTNKTGGRGRNESFSEKNMKFPTAFWIIII
jgi:hypothetical protein